MERKPLHLRLQAAHQPLSPAEERVATYFIEHPRRAVLASAAELAERLNVSDATVVRTARSLGYSGLAELRAALVAEIGGEPTPSERAAATFETLRGSDQSALDMVGRVHIGSIQRLLSATPRALFEEAVDTIASAARIVFFGQGPSRPIAEYGVVQLCRLGGTAVPFTRSGRALADDLLSLRKGDAVIAFVYGRISTDAAALFECSRDLDLRTIAITDTLQNKLRGEVSLMLAAERGPSDMLSLHATTLTLLEGLMLGCAMKQHDRALASLTQLDKLRQALDRRSRR